MTKNEQLRDDIIDYLAKEDAGMDVCIYCNGHAYQMDRKKGKPCRTAKGTVYYDIGERDVKEIKYSNPESVTMTFEGVLYDMINYGSAVEALNRIGHKYGRYLEQGYAWSLAFYEE